MSEMSREMSRDELVAELSEARRVIHFLLAGHGDPEIVPPADVYPGGVLEKRTVVTGVEWWTA